MNNEEFVRYIVGHYPNLEGLQWNHNALLFQNRECSLDRISLFDFFHQNKNLQRDIHTLTAQSFFELVDCHIKSFALQKANEKEQLSQIQENNPVIKNLRIIERKDKDGFIRTYVYFIDELNQMHLLERYAPTNILTIYKELLISHYGQVTAKDLYEELEKRHLKTVDLVSSHDVKKTYKPIDEEVKRTILSFEEQNQDSRDRVVASTDGAVYFKNQEAISANINEAGNTVFSKTSGGEFQNGTIEAANTQEIEGPKITDIMEKEKEEHVFISFQEYLNLLAMEEPFNETQQMQVHDLEGYLYDLYRYQEYLMPTLKEVLDYFKKLMEQLQVKELKSRQEEQALQRFGAFLEQVKQEDLTINKEKELQRLRQLTPPEKQAGYLNGVLLIGLVSGLGVLLSLLLIHLT